MPPSGARVAAPASLQQTLLRMSGHDELISALATKLAPARARSKSTARLLEQLSTPQSPGGQAVRRELADQKRKLQYLLAKCDLTEEQLASDMPELSAVAQGAAEGEGEGEGAAAGGGGEAAAAASAEREEIGPECFFRVGLLGRGAAGRAYLVKRKTGGDERLYAMKMLIKSELLKRDHPREGHDERGDDEIARAMMEAKVLREMDHPFVVRLYYSFQSDDFLYHVMDFCPGGNFYTLLRRQPQGHMSEETSKFYVAEIVSSLAYMHSKGYLYRDLKLENVLLGHDGHVRLTDFDLARHVGTEEVQVGKRTVSVLKTGTTSFVGTAEYISPEVILGKEAATQASDWWMVGILTYELLHGHTPFKGDSDRTTFQNIIKNKLSFPKARHKDEKLSKDAQDFVRSLLVRKPEKRLGFAGGAQDIREHSWFKGVNWSKLNNRRPPIVPTSALKPVMHEKIHEKFHLFGNHFTPEGKADEAEAVAAFADFDFVGPAAGGAQEEEVAEPPGATPRPGADDPDATFDAAQSLGDAEQKDSAFLRSVTPPAAPFFQHAGRAGAAAFGGGDETAEQQRLLMVQLRHGLQEFALENERLHDQIQALQRQHHPKLRRKLTTRDVSQGSATMDLEGHEGEEL